MFAGDGPAQADAGFEDLVAGFFHALDFLDVPAVEDDVGVDIPVAGVEKQAGPHTLAPTASPTAALAVGDALAVALLNSRGFTQEDFARSHPAGRLGRRLLVYVGDIMRTGDAVPTVKHDALLRDALLEMTGKGMGMTGVTDMDGKLLGILTDGDLRRLLNRNIDVRTAPVTEVMTPDPKTTRADRLAAETVALMRANKIYVLFVVDDSRRVIGAINMHDLLRAGVV